MLAAATLAHGIAIRQAFRDGNRRTAYFATRLFLDLNGLAHVSPLGHADHMLVRYLNGSVKSQGAKYPREQYHGLFHRRAINRRRVG